MPHFIFRTVPVLGFRFTAPYLLPMAAGRFLGLVCFSSLPFDTTQLSILGCLRSPELSVM